MSLHKPIRKLHISVLIVLLILVFQVSSAAENTSFLKIYFLDVGQGDAIFIETPSGRQVLIDGGPDNKILSELGRVMPFYDHSIDLVVVSHPHADHISGLIEVAAKYQIGKVIEAEETYDSPQFQAWEGVLEDKDVTQIEAVAGKQLVLEENLTLTILYPFDSVANTTTKTPHDDTVVAMLQFGRLKVLLTGDMEDSLERKLILSDVDLDADILKIGHHGSKTSSSEEFLKEITPSLAVIQTGKENKYNHPSKEVISRLESFKIPYYRNDTDGGIRVVSDGINFKVDIF